VEEIIDLTGFEFDREPSVITTLVPGNEELSLLRGPVAREIAANYPEFAQRVWNKYPSP
jgi:hypothetical protein